MSRTSSYEQKEEATTINPGRDWRDYYCHTANNKPMAEKEQVKYLQMQ